MHSHRFVAVAASAIVLAACNPFHRTPAVEVSAKDGDLNSRWHATLASPASLAGAVQMSGSATMAPGSNDRSTTVTLSLANASPGGVHPWQVHRGQCGADEGVFGSSGAYRPAKVGGDGRASESARVPMQMPTEGSYFVSVAASAANPTTTVACGNLARPTP
ncbi:MAG TPA: hypothetical protein VFQ38_04685 [Longimicrobiales bacterium]|nr:hypothetical protein [Longimicrobiales bacterium]